MRFAVSFIDLFITIIYAVFRKLLTTFYVSYAFTYVILSCINVYMFIFIKNEFIVFIGFIINLAMAGPKPGWERRRDGRGASTPIP